jgi:hypothetical protein
LELNVIIKRGITMPMYLHQDKNTKKKVEIIRSFDDYEDTPTVEEAMREGLSEDEAKNAQWVKIIVGGAGHVGFGLKGFWVLILIPFLFGCPGGPFALEPQRIENDEVICYKTSKALQCTWKKKNTKQCGGLI